MSTLLFLEQTNEDSFQIKVRELLVEIDTLKDLLTKEIEKIKESIRRDFALTDSSESYNDGQKDKIRLKRKRSYQ